ncbi:hypothetical protein Patl1_15565 [Pistacia atlantica]|uniref:Uncharacterized protein n=1 Tax=Pistacia atlantica TaxID=434234 RepID=A0ACC1B8D3_9ROSI|nr:hypothetical protein Patl1_15565 [Pistacia atlantica]
METCKELALTQMRKSLDNLASSPEKYVDETLMRFLIARSMDPEKAAKMFVQWQKWRAAFVPNGFISESEVPDELEARKIFLQELSKDRYPVLICKASKHFPAKDPVQFKKFVVHLLDKTIASSFRGREIGNEKLIAILDLQQISYKNVDARGLITGFPIFAGMVDILVVILHWLIKLGGLTVKQILALQQIWACCHGGFQLQEPSLPLIKCRLDINLSDPIWVYIF